LCSSERSFTAGVFTASRVREANAGWLDPRNGPARDKLIAQSSVTGEKLLKLDAAFEGKPMLPRFNHPKPRF